MHDCPNPACSAKNIPDTLLLCRRCWRRVPAEIQSDVWRTWHARQRARSLKQKIAAASAYHEARQAAIDSISGCSRGSMSRDQEAA
jgi:hypothetical protein